MLSSLLAVAALLTAAPDYNARARVEARSTSAVASSPAVQAGVAGQMAVFTNVYLEQSLQPELRLSAHKDRWRLQLSYLPELTRRDYLLRRGLLEADTYASGRIMTFHEIEASGVYEFKRNWRYTLLGRYTHGQAVGSAAAVVLNTQAGTPGNSPLSTASFYDFRSASVTANASGDLTRRLTLQFEGAFLTSEPLGDPRRHGDLVVPMTQVSAQVGLGYRLTRADHLRLTLEGERIDYRRRSRTETAEAMLILEHDLTAEDSFDIGVGAGLTRWKLLFDPIENDNRDFEGQHLRPRAYLGLETMLWNFRASSVSFRLEGGLVGFSDPIANSFYTRIYADASTLWAFPPDWSLRWIINAATPMDDPVRWTANELNLLLRPIRAPESLLRSDLTAEYEYDRHFMVFFGGAMNYRFTRFSPRLYGEFQYDSFSLEVFAGIRLTYNTEHLAYGAR